MRDPTSEMGKGYVALDVLVGLLYVGGFAYACLGFALTAKTGLGLLMAAAGAAIMLAAYVLHRIGRAVFIIRDRGGDTR